MLYPAWVAWYASDPMRGLPREKTFRPSIAEIADYCYRIYGEHRGANAQAKQIAQQIEDRKRLPSPEDFPEHREAVVEKRLKQLGEHFGIEQPGDKAVSIPPLETVMAKYPGGPMAGLKLSPETMQTMAVQKWLKSMDEAYADVEGDDDPD